MSNFIIRFFTAPPNVGSAPGAGGDSGNWLTERKSFMLWIPKFVSELKSFITDLNALVPQLQSDAKKAEDLTAILNDKQLAFDKDNVTYSIAAIDKLLAKKDDITDVDKKIRSVEFYHIGKAGGVGFGVGVVPEDDLPSYLVPMAGTYVAGHGNYGNYFHPLSSSILVFIPRCYYKIVNNVFHYDTHKRDDDFVLDRAFINNGKEIKGIFVSKYQGSNHNGYFASVKNADPVSTAAAHNPVSNINGCNENRYDELYTACKSLGSDFFLTSIFTYSMLARMAVAHAMASTSTVNCAFKDKLPYMPKGCNNNALKDANDSSVVYASSGYSNCGKTGSASIPAKVAHNGQNCGVMDLNGNMWEVASGFTRDASSFKILKESTDIAALTEDSAYDFTNYDDIDISDLVSGNDGWIKLGNGANPVFSFSDDRTSNSYRRTSLSIPASTGISSGGTTEFGNDAIYRYLRSDMTCLVGGSWSSGSVAGAFALTLSSDRSYSSYAVGGRASVFL